MANLVQKRMHVEARRMEIELTIDDLRRTKQTVNQAGHAQHRAANFPRTLSDLVGAGRAIHLCQALGVAVYDRQWRAEFVGYHRDEVALQLRKAALLRLLLLEHGSLMRQAALGGRELDRIVPEHDDGPRHLADLVAAFRALDIDIYVVCGELPHASGKAQQRRRERAPDIEQRRDHHRSAAAIAALINQRACRYARFSRSLAS